MKREIKKWETEFYPADLIPEPLEEVLVKARCVDDLESVYVSYFIGFYDDSIGEWLIKEFDLHLCSFEILSWCELPPISESTDD